MLIYTRDGELESVREQRNVICDLLKLPKPKPPVSSRQEIVSQLLASTAVLRNLCFCYCRLGPVKARSQRWRINWPAIGVYVKHSGGILLIMLKFFFLQIWWTELATERLGCIDMITALLL